MMCEVDEAAVTREIGNDAAVTSEEERVLMRKPNWDEGNIATSESAGDARSSSDLEDDA